MLCKARGELTESDKAIYEAVIVENGCASICNTTTPLLFTIRSRFR